ncbi:MULTISPECIES: F0F1 ATP synthase subunit B [Brucella]|jgi:F-type H+-transporting ATPase subunit b|uniref:ATP synthase subunit b n=3 Tax=Brucella TaxID=234 RepID=A0A7Y3T6B1_9HYPH|nr:MULTISPECIES: F0F1 ATP synthase subunit B [Brucella]EMG55043.1 F0F1 ATP synthase subunit B [Ochrobactrum sp. CDB2]MBK0020378.1 F0F1 ATP synthase subunit B [Ochrobactrum sp. S45]MBK0042882.1 F0F1 ATP synthase subunit B [Ochrobactrum sp. S46]MBO1025191.1 F0F1 ATP synthase subunit B [Ochrobactrum sp. SD129]MQP39470.1 F0F1 ATP synthase subunit B [Ochrobactrum sp. MYb237]QWK78037.1 F0F1 ATP synthase subunit B [Ochrobactrum sp. BTU1]TCQ82293.1 F-type H+-transporting ATPase subunit b [Ochrobactr
MDSTFWAFIALLLFIALIVYLKVPGMIGRSLDERAENIKKELEEARTLREEAQQLLAEYHRKRKEAEKEAGDIVAAAEREAKALLEDAKRATEEYVVRRNKLAEQKIATAETDAINAVRASAVDLAVAAAGKIVADKVDAKVAGTLFKDALGQVKTNLN